MPKNTSVDSSLSAKMQDELIINPVELDAQILSIMRNNYWEFKICSNGDGADLMVATLTYTAKMFLRRICRLEMRIFRI